MIISPGWPWEHLGNHWEGLMEVAREKDVWVALLTSCRHDPVLDTQTSPRVMTIPYTPFHTMFFLLFLHTWAKTNHIGQ